MVLYRFHTTFGQLQIVFLRAANVRVTGQGQRRIRLVGKIFLEVGCQGVEPLLLAFKQPAIWIGSGGPIRGEVNRMQGQPAFQLLDLRGLLHVHIGGGAGAAAAAVIGRASHRVAARGNSGRVKRPGWTRTGDLSARSRIALGQRIAVRIARRGNDVHLFAGVDGAAFRRAGNDRRPVGPLGNGDVRSAGSRAAPPVIDLRVDGVRADSHA